jgi:PAS domain S-box-containing protein
VSENSTTAATATSEVVEELLRQLVDARFVLTDRDGAVTRWSRPAEELFGWPGARMLGRALPETLGMAESLPRDGGVLQTTVRRKNGNELEVTLTLVPVGMSQSLEFNGFLEALEIAAPRGNALQQLQQSHRTVVDWIHAAMRGEARLEDDDLAAGTIVAFRPLVEPPPPPPTEEDVEDAYTELELDAVEQAAEFVEVDASRIDAVEELGERLAGELGATRDALTELRGSVEKLEAELAEAPQADDDELRTALSALERTVARVEQLEADDTQRKLVAELAELRERADAGEDAVAAAQRVHERLEELERSLSEGGERERSLGASLAEMSARVDELTRGLADDEAETEQRSKANAERDEQLRRELDETRAKLEAIAGERIEEQRTLAGELAETHAKLEALERAMGDEHERADEARERLAELGHELAELRSAPPAAPAPGAEPASAAAAEAAGEALKAIERLTARAEQAADAARSHSSRAYDASGAAEARASRAEEAAAAAEAQASRAAESIAGVEQRSERAEQALATVQEQVLAARQAADSVQQGAQAALADVEQRSGQAREIVAAVEAQATRAGAAVSAAEAHAVHAEAAVASLDEKVRRAEEAAAAARAEGEELLATAVEVQEAAERATSIQARMDAQMARVEESMSEVERGAIRAEAAASSAAGDAKRSGQEAGRLAEIATAAEQQAELAREAAEAAEQAAIAARTAAGEAEAAGQRTRDAERPLVRVDAPANGHAPAGNGNGHDPRRPLFSKRDTGPTRPPRPGFDDASNPMAVIALDGHFKELNPAFTDLVGYSEAEFAAAVWPPVMDRANLQTHREQMKAMLAGEIETAQVKTGYVHAQGLLVPVVGTIKLVREDGKPSHYLLEATGR